MPKGCGPFLRKHGATRVKELEYVPANQTVFYSDVNFISWWQETKHTLSRPGQKDRTYTITAVPSMHWSARSPLDTNATLWAAFHVKSDTDKPKSFIHLGDTG